MNRAIELLEDSAGKLSWNRCIATVIVIVVLVAFFIGVKIPAEVVEILKVVLGFQVAGMALSSSVSSFSSSKIVVEESKESKKNDGNPTKNT